MKFPKIEAAALDAGVAFAADEFGVELSHDDLRGPSRRMVVSEARKVAILEMRKSGAMSLDDIGAALGGRDHSTIHYALGGATGRFGADLQSPTRARSWP